MAGGLISDAEMDGMAPGGPSGHLTDEQMEDASLGLAPSRPSVGAGETILRGASQGFLLNHRDELVGALETALDRLRGIKNTTYEQHRDESRAADARAQTANPGLYGASEIGGALLPLAIPGVGEVLGSARLATQVGAGALQGAVAAAGATETLGEVPGALAHGSLTGGLAGGAGALTGRVIGKVASRLAPGLQETADNATLRAIGQEGHTLKNMTAAKRGEMAEMGRAFLDPTDTVGHVSDKLVAGRKASNDAIGEILTSMDNEAAGAGFSATHDLEVAQKLRGVLDAAASDPGISASARNALGEIVTNLENRAGPMSMKELDALRKTLQGRVRYSGSTIEQMAPGSNQIMAQGAKMLRQHIDDVGGQIHAGLSAELSEAYGLSHAITPLAIQSQKAAGKIAGNKAIALSGRLGVVAGASTALAGHPGGLLLIAAGFAAKGLEQRANAFAGVALNKLAKAAANPMAAQALGKWGAYVASAAQRGPTALAAAHYTASQMDSQYAANARTIMNQPEQTDSGNDDVLPGAPPLDTSIDVKEP